MGKKVKLSVYVLAYNEENKIADTLKSVDWADELVVIDSFSTDRTVEISKELGAKVVQVNFEGFGKLRLAGIKHTSHDWIFSIDSDERCTPEAKEEIIDTINQESSKDAYFMPRRNIFMGKKIKFCGWYPNYRQPQLFKRGKMTYEAKDLVHEDYRVDGKIGHLQIPIFQIPFLTISEILQKMDRYSELGAEKIIDKKKECPSSFNIIFRSLWTFIRIYILRLGILDGWAGFVIAFCNMEGTFYRYAKLKDLTRLKDKTKS
jgi:glycosyltransferase involved in cell wall biosynthesis